MHRITRLRPTPAMVAAAIALLAALGGAGYAATSLPANSVGTAQTSRRSLGRESPSASRSSVECDAEGSRS